MAIGTLRSGVCLLFYLSGLVSIYLGERLIGGVGIGRFVVSGVGLLCVVACSACWVLAFRKSKGDARRIEGWAAVFSLGGLLAVVLYGASSDFLGSSVTKSGSESVGWREVFYLFRILLLVFSVVPLLFLQWSVGFRRGEKAVESPRVFASMRAGLTLVVFLATLFFINAIVNRKDAQVDLSYLKATSPSDGTRSLVSGLDEDTKIRLFFPPGNDVLEEVRSYFEELARISPRFQISVEDRAMAPELVKQYRVSKDGSVVLARGENRQILELGTDLDQAGGKIRRLDADFQSAFLKLLRKREAVYLFSGHGERSTERGGETGGRISILKEVLQANNFDVKPFGMVQGSANAVPEDAAMVMMIGPTEPLFPGEQEALQSYLEKGGRFLLMLDPAGKADLEKLLSFLGLKFQAVKLANDRAHVLLSKTEADQYNIVTDSFSSHPAVTTMSQHSRELPVAMPLSGSLEKTPEGKMKVDFIVRSLASTWADADSNMAAGDNEKRQVFQLAAAIGLTSAKKEEKVDPSRPEDKASSPKSPKVDSEMRAVVMAGSEAFSDTFLPFNGNRYLMADVLRWLAEEGRMTGSPNREEDVAILHTRGQDVFWFYGTVFAVPLLILAVGLGTNFGRGRRRRSGP
jgi:hypothetical protein